MVIENRKLTKWEFFAQLQMEYIATLVRLYIFDSEKDKQYYTDLLDRKRKKINDLIYRRFSDISATDSILNNKNKFDKYLEKFLGDGYPNFTYSTNNAYNETFARLDFRKYYTKGCQVTIQSEGLELNGTVLYSVFATKEVFVKVGNAKQSFQAKQVKRDLCITF
jgi:hypothetical protein